MAGKISKDKKKYIIAGISGILVIILILTAYSINSAKNDKKPTTDVSVEDSDKKVKSQSSASSDGGRVASTVEIEFEDSAVLVGTRFKVTAIVTPSDTDKALLWSSSDDSVFSVDENGIVTVKGTGNAVLTATVGTVSDAVVIEGITDAATGSSENLPVFIADSYDSSYTVSGSSGNRTGTQATGSGSSSYQGSSENGSSYQGTSGTSGGQTASGGQNSGSDYTGSSGNAWSDNSGSNNSGNQNQDNGGNNNSGSQDSGNTDNGSSGGQTSSTIGESLPALGFNHMMSNVYVYEEGNNYYGEVITQPNVAIIYIMQRSSGFDNVINQVLQRLVPGGASQIWNNYSTATTDKTFNVSVSGYNYAWYGACEQSVIDANTHAVKGAKIGIVDVKTGEITPIDGAVTDENGNATVNIDKAGKYIVTAYVDDKDNTPILMQQATINVEWAKPLEVKGVAIAKQNKNEVSVLSLIHI